MNKEKQALKWLITSDHTEAREKEEGKIDSSEIWRLHWTTQFSESKKKKD